MVMLIDRPTLKRKTTGLWQKEAIPPEFAWITRLSSLHYRIFIAELHDATSHACITDDWDRVERLLEDWEATAQLDANPDLAEYLLSEPKEKGYEELDPSDL